VKGGVVNRLDVYTAVHKMQRARLFKLTVEAGTTDPADPIAVVQLAAAVGALADELVAHAGHEEIFIHPLLREKAPAVAARLDADHVELDASLDHLRRMATPDASTPKALNDLYRALAGFTARYLDHLALEEGEALPALWAGCTDAELTGILTAFKESRSVAENLASVLAQLATLNPSEIAGMVTFGLGPVSVSELGDVLATVLSPRRLGGLRMLQPV
jgi:hypothetical protein